MPMFFIQVRDGDTLYGEDNRGVEAPNLASMLPHIQQTVRDIIDDEGGPKMAEARLIEVVDRSGTVLITLPFATAYARH